MICFCYFCLKSLPFWAWPIMTPFLCKLVSKKQFLRGFTNFFQNCWIATQVININCIPNICHWKSAKKAKWAWSLGQNLGQIRSNVVKKTKKLVFQWFFFIFCMRYTFTSKKVRVIEKPE